MIARIAASRWGPLIALAALAAVLVGGAGVWYLFFRSAGPPPVSLASLPPASPPPAGATVAPSGGATAGAPGAGIGGTWQVDPSVGSFSDFSGSFVGYRVREELARVGATEAVGRTPDVSGSVTIEGTSITAAEMTADLTTLRSDESNRDRQLSRQALETSRFPTATFTLTAPVDLGTVPAEGQVIDLTLRGDLSLHGVTQPVELPVQGRLAGGVITVAGSLPIVFADYGIQPPQAVVVLSVEDHGIMEFQLQLTRAR
jgi:polyisoprenoid-binding protein YceI